MVINTKAYADFKLAANTLRHLDAVFYNPSTVTIQSELFGVAYAFDYQSNVCVCLQLFNTALTAVPTDFPSAVAIGEYLLIQDASALNF